MKTLKKKKEQKYREKIRQEVLYQLPGFINQLLLFSDCGLVLTECFFKVGQAYQSYSEKRKNYFTNSIVEICNKSKETNENVVILFQRFARLSGIKELTRIGNILSENQNKGTDLWDKLREQSVLLWEERKQMTLAKIKVAESKLTFPMGMLLLALIIVTAAPSFLKMG